MPRSGVGGLGGELGWEMKEVSEDRETGEVGNDTVIGGLVFRFRLKRGNHEQLKRQERSVHRKQSKYETITNVNVLLRS